MGRARSHPLGKEVCVSAGTTVSSPHCVLMQSHKQVSLPLLAELNVFQFCSVLVAM